MRLVQVMVPTGKRETVLGVLDDEKIDYVVTDETSGREYSAVVSFPIPTEAVEHVLQRLREAGIERESYTVVLTAEIVLSQKFKELERAYETNENTKEDRIAREEIIVRAQELAPTLSTYLLMTIVSSVIATAGVLLDSPAVVVGSMVIAPLIGPAMTTAVGTVIDDRSLYGRGLKLQILGFFAAVGAAAAFAFLVKTVHLVPPGMDPTTIQQVASRLTPDFLSLAVALGAGIAGAISLRTGVSTSLVGVMIAVALVPPIAVVGVGIAWGLPAVVIGATVLAGVNFLSINLAAITTLWYSGYRPTNWFRRDQARSTTAFRVGVLVTAIVVMSVFLGGTTYVSYATAVSDAGICDDVVGVVNDSEYERVHVLSVQTIDDSQVWRYPPDPGPEFVLVRVSAPPNETYPGLPNELRSALTSDGREVQVGVQFVESLYAPSSMRPISAEQSDGNTITCRS